MDDDNPVSDRRFLVQYTDTNGGRWIGDLNFKIVDSARARMTHLVDGEHKASARVLQELHYRASQISI